MIAPPLRIKIYDQAPEELVESLRAGSRKRPVTTVYRIYRCEKDLALSALGTVYSEYRNGIPPHRFSPDKMDALLRRMGFCFFETLTLYGKNKPQLRVIERKSNVSV